MDITLKALRETVGKYENDPDDYTRGIAYGIKIAIEAIERGMTRDAARS